MAKFSLEIVLKELPQLLQNKVSLEHYAKISNNGKGQLIDNKLLNNPISVARPIPKNKGGVYAFWWTGDKEFFKRTINRKLPVKGPGGTNVTLEIDDNWIDSYEDGEICLYIGKNNSSIKSRVGQHLRLDSKRDTKVNSKPVSLFRKAVTTSCQLKNGIEKLFPQTEDIRDLILQNISLSFVEMDGEEQALNRFFLEDKAIGEYYPIINMDIER